MMAPAGGMNPGVVARRYYHVFKRINKQLPSLTTLELQYVSPALVRAEVGSSIHMFTCVTHQSLQLLGRQATAVQSLSCTWCCLWHAISLVCMLRLHCSSLVLMSQECAGHTLEQAVVITRSTCSCLMTLGAVGYLEQDPTAGGRAWSLRCLAHTCSASQSSP